MENSKRKNIYIVIFIITTIIAGCLAVYLGIVKNKDNNIEELQLKVNEMETKNKEYEKQINDLNKTTDENKNVETKEEKIPITDLYGFDTIQMTFVKVTDGYLYYYMDKSNYENKGDFFSTNSNDEQYQKLDSNIKRIKTVMLGSDVSISYLAIKNDGTVYCLKVVNDGAENKKIDYEEYSYFKGYKIDDVISIRGISGKQSGIVAKVKLLDGTIKEINTVK